MPADDQAIWDRILLIPFTARFKGTSVEDLDLSRKLRDELPGILRWAVEGCLLWQQEGLRAVPEKVRASSEQYRAGEDVVGQFVEAECEVKKGSTVRAKRLYLAYRAWADGEGQKPMGNRRFKEQLEAMGYTQDREPGDGHTLWFGLSLVSADEAPVTASDDQTGYPF